MKTIQITIKNDYLYIKSENINIFDFKNLPLRKKGYFFLYIKDISENNEWIFKDNISFSSDIFKIIDIIELVKECFPDSKIIVDDLILKNFKIQKHTLKEYEMVGKNLKDLTSPEIIDRKNIFEEDVEKIIKKRKLSSSQIDNSFYHYVMQSSLNFSVPGAGKTTTVLATYAILKFLEEKVDNLLVIGPKSCFKSWIDEYNECFDFYPNVLRSDKAKISSTNFSTDFAHKFLKSDLILINYESVSKFEKALLKVLSDKTFIVYDESHKIKKYKGKWAKPCLRISTMAKYKVLLTGTPLPNGYEDIYNALVIMKGDSFVKSYGWTYEKLKSEKEFYSKDFAEKLFPFYVRTSKEDLKVPKPEPDNIFKYHLSDVEIDIYKEVLQAYKGNGFALVVRLLQSLSDPLRLKKVLSREDFESFADFDEKMFNEIKLNKLLKSLDKIDRNFVPSKIKSLVSLVESLRKENKTILIWCSFVMTMNSLRRMLSKYGSVAIINGSTPMDERFEIIEKFKSGEIEILISNVQTIAESVSLHKNCHDAIYFDYSYNLTHMLQSRDRIHRFGLPSDTITNYYYFHADNVDKSIEKIIYNRLEFKNNLMQDILNSKSIVIENEMSENDFVNQIVKELLA